MAHRDFDKNVFVNCPFDAEYESILQAILFCLVRFGLFPRIATERSDAGETRLTKIRELIEASKFSIHDLSRCQSREAGEFARLNMPFELGLDFGCRTYFGEPQAQKVILILEEEPYRYQAALSDLAGSDISVHEGDYAKAIRKVRNWLVGMGTFENVGAARVVGEYEDFQEWFFEEQLNQGSSEEDILDSPTPELLDGMYRWVENGMPRQ
ncbi:MAG: hypothetical protein ABJP79_04365 [Tateyamaria sp.]|uniref:hypothetical protein n=1 Tax=Tateyamaria sp. TaxID=1929288 RepID=UPI00329FDD7D